MIGKKINKSVNDLFSGLLEQKDFEEKYYDTFTSKDIIDALEIAYAQKDGNLLSNTFFIAFSFNLIDDSLLHLLRDLLLENWHREHEDIVSLFQRRFNTDIDVIPILTNAINDIPIYIIENGDKYSYLRKIIYAIGYHPFPHNRNALLKLLEINDETLKELIKHQLKKKYCNNLR
ncbi:MAG: hypothetical protein RL757_631 [Bacteroidota bacterium]|jgi:hypothetical protein